ncbi:amino acid adenylation domain-containing protein [Microseira sp. BLCC-F43]|uniref:amino acid adenylation domain-containing protein n=1 Tax=Microseira sp. BLCC-F43 TaxID=3153602 RepID=UPI0035BA7593
MSNNNERIAALSPEKRQMLVQQLYQKTAKVTRSRSVPNGTSPITPQNRDVNCFPLSFAQARLWFLDQLEPGKPFYNISSALLLKGSLNLAALEQSLNEVIRRHEILRTSFATVDGQPVQVIEPNLKLTLNVQDLRQLPPIEQQQTVQQLIAQSANQPFDLTQLPLLRVSLLHVGESEYVMLLVMHHIISDGWSMGVLIREMVALYKAYGAGKPSPLAEVTIQYADFAVWQRSQKEAIASQITYWKQQLSGNLPVLQLPTDRPRPPVQTFKGARQSLLLTKNLTPALKKLSQQENATLFVTLLAAFQTLLYRYTNQADICVGSPIANRNRVEIEGSLGVFVNTLVLRTDLAGNPTFRELLGRVREVALAAYSHQDLPFEKLVEELQPQRDLSRNPLFQVMFALQNAPMPEIALEGLTIDTLNVETNRAQFDLSLAIVENSQGAIAEVEYSTDLFEAATIARMLKHFETLLEGIVANPDRCLSDLPILTASERQQLLVDWNDTFADYPKDCCIHQLFEAQVEQTPDAVAAIFDAQTLTYCQLNAKANQLAHYLRSLGVKPEQLVGVCVERSLEMMVGILGILKAGGAYLPLDSSYPSERLAFMLEDARIGILLTQQHLIEKLPQSRVKIACLDTDWEEISQHSQENPHTNVTAENLAYVIYTSGSTGTPKGVEITHQDLTNHSIAVAKAYQLQSSDRILQFGSISFDVSAEEIFPSWLSGATVVIRPEEILDFANFGQFLAQEKVTVVNLPTTYWHEWVSYLVDSKTELPPTLRLAIVGTEAVQPEQLVIWEKQVGNRVRWINAYGPTEATIGVTLYELTTSDRQLSCVPIGRPIANTQIYILDSHLQPVPIGVTGEIYIGGDSLSRGYLNRPYLTAEKFILNPFERANSQSLKPSRLYKTGDLARYLPDGNIQLIGRIDSQVKIRGFRIELGEIETILKQHPAVRDAVVLAQEESEKPNHKRLVAYIVAKETATTTVEMRDLLTKKLPNYMVPSGFVILEILPLLPNGKVDRNALLHLNLTPHEPETKFVEPSTTIEGVLAKIWAEVLRIEQVGIHDNFFELGGDSILSIQAIARANKAGLRLTPKQLFEHQTIAELAAVASTIQTTEAQQGLVTGEVHLTPIQHWFFQQNLPQPHHFNQAVLLQVEQNCDLALLQQTIQQLVLHHDALRLRFVQTEFGWKQEIANPDAEVPLTRLDFSALPEVEQIAALEAAINELQSSLNLSVGPLIRVAYFDFGVDKPSRLLFVIHHLAIDGVSWRILLEDLSRGEAIDLPPKTTSFQQWSNCLQEYARSASLQQEQNYWLTESRSLVSRLPVDYPEGDNTVASADRVAIALNAEQTQALLQEVPKAYNTQINDVLLAALVMAFAKWTGDRSLLVDLESHGREQIFDNLDLSRTVGWFTSVFPIILNQESNPRETLKAVKEQLRGVPNRGIGYGILRYLGDNKIAEQLKNLPQAEVIFNYLGQFDRTLSESSLFSFARESTGNSRSLQGTRSHLFEIDGLVNGGQLSLSWTYSKNLYQKATVEYLAQTYLEVLRELIVHCQSPDAGGYTPSDFPDVDLNQEQLENLLAEIGAS